MGYEAQHRESDSSAMSGPSVMAGFQMYCARPASVVSERPSEWLHRRCSRTAVDRPARCKRRLCKLLLERLYRRPSRRVSVRPPPFFARPPPLRGNHPTIVWMLHDTSMYSQPKYYSRTQSLSTISLAYAHRLIPMS